MSFVDNITPKIALETIGLRRDEVQMADLVMPVLVAFGLGLGIGVGAALLLAPQSGRELRDDLKTRAGKIEKNVRKALPGRRVVDDNGVDDDENGDFEYEGGSQTGSTVG